MVVESEALGGADTAGNRGGLQPQLLQLLRQVAQHRLGRQQQQQQSPAWGLLPRPPRHARSLPLSLPPIGYVLRHLDGPPLVIVSVGCWPRRRRSLMFSQEPSRAAAS